MDPPLSGDDSPPSSMRQSNKKLLRSLSSSHRSLDSELHSYDQDSYLADSFLRRPQGSHYLDGEDGLEIEHAQLVRLLLDQLILLGYTYVYLAFTLLFLNELKKYSHLLFVCNIFCNILSLSVFIIQSFYFVCGKHFLKIYFLINPEIISFLSV